MIPKKLHNAYVAEKRKRFDEIILMELDDEKVVAKDGPNVIL